MTQILNVPMPADEAIKIINNIYDSNRMVDIEITIWDVFKATFIKATECIIFSGMKSSRWAQRVYEMEYNPSYIITIKSITPIIPTYSVWDEVMILATGEIGEVTDVVDNKETGNIEIEVWQRWCYNEAYHRSEICKIA